MESNNVVYFEKYCGMCRETKPITEFYKSTRFKSGVTSNCKVCIRGISRKCDKRRYHETIIIKLIYVQV